MLRADCDFCKELSGDSRNAFDKIYAGDPASRILFRSNEFAVIPSLGQIVEGYLLVLPVEHFWVLGDLPTFRLDEFAAVCEQVGRVLKDEYGPYILFEHGTRPEGTGGCGIFHAHLHAMPLCGMLDPIETLKLKFPQTELCHLHEIGPRSVGLSSYLFYQDSEARRFLFDTGPLSSQYMRRLFAEKLGRQDWNWRTVGREERLLATIARLTAHFERMQNSTRPRDAR